MPFYLLYLAVMVAACMFAGVIFGGRTLLTGSPLAEAEKTHIVVAEAAEAADTGTATAEVAPAFDYATYVADATKGAALAAKCKACHTFEQGGANRTGPNLWGVVNRKVAGHEGFAYSTAMVDHAKAAPVWDDKALFEFIENPRKVVEGTKMQFAGLKKPEERADLIAYLKTLK